MVISGGELNLGSEALVQDPIIDFQKKLRHLFLLTVIFTTHLTYYYEIKRSNLTRELKRKKE